MDRKNSHATVKNHLRALNTFLKYKKPVHSFCIFNPLTIVIYPTPPPALYLIVSHNIKLLLKYIISFIIIIMLIDVINFIYNEIVMDTDGQVKNFFY